MCDKQTIREFIAKHSGLDPEYLEDDLPLTELVIDSFDVVNLIIAIQQEKLIIRSNQSQGYTWQSGPGAYIKNTTRLFVLGLSVSPTDLLVRFKNLLRVTEP